MPIFEFTSPEGQVYEVEGPEGATPEQAFGVLSQQLEQQTLMAAPKAGPAEAEAKDYGAMRSDPQTDALVLPAEPKESLRVDKRGRTVERTPEMAEAEERGRDLSSRLKNLALGRSHTFDQAFDAVKKAHPGASKDKARKVYEAYMHAREIVTDQPLEGEAYAREVVKNVKDEELKRMIGSAVAELANEKRQQADRIDPGLFDRTMRAGITSTINLFGKTLPDAAVSFADFVFTDEGTERDAIRKEGAAAAREGEFQAGQLAGIAKAGNPLIKEDDPFLAKTAIQTAEMAPALIGSAAATGIAGPAGGIAFWTAATQKDVYTEARSRGLSDDSANKISLVAAPAIAAIEMINIDPTGITKKLGGQTLKQWITKQAFGYLKELGEEGLQAGTQELAIQFGAHLTGEAQKAGIEVDFSEAISRGFKEAVEAAGPMAVIMGPSTVAGGVQTARRQAYEKAIAAEVKADADAIEKQVAADIAAAPVEMAEVIEGPAVKESLSTGKEDLTVADTRKQELMGMDFGELQKLAKERGVKAFGKRQVLADRIIKAETKEPEPVDTPSPVNLPAETTAFVNTVLDRGNPVEMADLALAAEQDVNAEEWKKLPLKERKQKLDAIRPIIEGLGISTKKKSLGKLAEQWNANAPRRQALAAQLRAGAQAAQVPTPATEAAQIQEAEAAQAAQTTEGVRIEASPQEQVAAAGLPVQQRAGRFPVNRKLVERKKDELREMLTRAGSKPGFKKRDYLKQMVADLKAVQLTADERAQLVAAEEMLSAKPLPKKKASGIVGPAARSEQGQQAEQDLAQAFRDSLETDARRALAGGDAAAAELMQVEAGLRAEAFQNSLTNLSDQALVRMRQNLKGIQHVPTIEELTELGRRNGVQLADNEIVGGFFTDDGWLVLDGRWSEAEARSFAQAGLPRDLVGLYMHEVMHAVDGPAWELSQSSGWKLAWDAELNPELKGVATLNAYSKIPEEAFAEFGRLALTGSPAQKALLLKHFPVTYQAWLAMDMPRIEGALDQAQLPQVYDKVLIGTEHYEGRPMPQGGIADIVDPQDSGAHGEPKFGLLFGKKAEEPANLPSTLQKATTRDVAGRLWARVKGWVGVMPGNTKALMQQAERQMLADIKRLAVLDREMKALAPEATEQDQRAWNDIMQRRRSLEEAPEGLRPLLQEARNTVDTLSRNLLRAGAIPGPLRPLVEMPGLSPAERRLQLSQMTDAEVADMAKQLNIATRWKRRKAAKRRVHGYDEAAKAFKRGTDREHVIEAIVSTTEGLGLGAYLHRSYRVQTNPGQWWDELRQPQQQWRLDGMRRWLRAVLSEQRRRQAQRVARSLGEDAVDLHFDEPSDAEVEAELDRWLAEAFDPKRGPLKTRLPLLGSKRRDALMRRAKVPQAVRDLWGEEDRFLGNLVSTVEQQSQLLAKHEALKAIRDDGLAQGYLSTSFQPGLVMLSAERASALEPLAGLYTAPEIREEFENYYAAAAQPAGRVEAALDEFKKAWFGGRWLYRMAAVGANPTKWVRQGLSNLLYLVRGGHVNLLAQVPSLDGAGSMSVVSKAIQGYLGSKSRGSKEARAYGIELVEQGMAEGGIISGATAELIKSLDGKDVSDWVHTLVKWSAEGLVATDAVPRIIYYEMEKADHRRINPHWTEQQVIEAAGRKVRATYQDYSQLPPIVRLLQKAPFGVGDFAAFHWDNLRTAIGTYSLIAEELSDANPAMKAKGVKRLLGAAAAHTFGTGLMYASWLLMGWGDADDDEALRKSLAPWARNHPLVILGKDNQGSVDYVDLDFVSPFGAFEHSLTALLRGDPVGAMASQLEPLFGTDLLGERVVDVLRNRTEDDREVYNPEASGIVKAEAVLLHLGSGAVPTDWKKAWKGEMAHFAGSWTGKRTFDAARSFKFKAIDHAKAERDVDRLLTSVATRGGREGDDRSPPKPEELVAAYLDKERARKAHFEQQHREYWYARRLGVPEETLDRMLLERDTPKAKADLERLKTGEYQPWMPSDRWLKDSVAEPAEAQRRREIVLAVAEQASGFLVQTDGPRSAEALSYLNEQAAIWTSDPPSPRVERKKFEPLSAFLERRRERADEIKAHEQRRKQARETLRRLGATLEEIRQAVIERHKAQGGAVPETRRRLGRAAGFNQAG